MFAILWPDSFLFQLTLNKYCEPLKKKKNFYFSYWSIYEILYALYNNLGGVPWFMCIW